MLEMCMLFANPGHNEKQRSASRWKKTLKFALERLLQDYPHSCDSCTRGTSEVMKVKFLTGF